MAYNGWTNKETWLVNLWLGDMFTVDQEAGNFNGFVKDLLNCALGEIDYHEIAEHYDEEVLEDV